MNRVNFCIPPIKCYAHHAFPLGVILTNGNAKDWFFCNYSYIYFGGDMNQYNCLAQYSKMPFLYQRDIYKEEFDSGMTMEDYHQWIKKQIEKGYAVLLFADRFYLPDSDNYQKEHYPHEILIVGYENELCIYWDYAGQMLKECRCTWNNIMVSSDKYYKGKDRIAKLYAAEDGEFQYDEKFIWRQIKDYFNSYNPYDALAVWGKYHCYKDFIFGRDANKCLANLWQETERIDIRYADAFYEHKKCMRMRLEYAAKRKDGLGIITKADLEFWKQTEQRSNILLNMVLKYNIINWEGVHSERLFVNIMNEFRQICVAEDEWMGKIVEGICL